MVDSNLTSILNNDLCINIPQEFLKKTICNGNKLYQEAALDRLAFWEEQAKQLHWFSDWKTVLSWDRPYAKWFEEGTLNACYNCLDVHMQSDRKSKTALIFEGEKGKQQTYTYEQLHNEVCRLASIMEYEFKIKKGDRVTLYLPMIPQLVISVLACARIGAIHSVVFAGFSSKSLRDRIEDSQSRLLITANGGFRRGEIIPLQSIVKEALNITGHTIETVLCVEHIENIPLAPDFLSYQKMIVKGSSNHKAQPMKSEDPLFILYTSGTTGKPKGIIHSTGGYLTHAKYSTKVVFDLQEDDIYFCTADIGWITGHTYVVYGPLSNGATVLIYEGAPDYPEKDRFWELIEKYKVSIFYTAPTAIRTFIKWGDEFPNKHDLKSLRLLGSVGEPINPETWMWYYEVIGHKKCPIVDTWWQTETGGIMITTIPHLHKMKPGDAGLPLPGIDAAILSSSGENISSGGGLLSIMTPWPSMLRGIWGDSKRFEDVYWSSFPSYFAGDGAHKDKDGYFRILGRVDDVLNVAGHRIGTMEVESCLVNYPGIAEAAVVGIADAMKGQAILAFVILKEGIEVSSELENKMKQFVAKEIGAIAKPKKIVFVPELPKTRSGKIIRRALKSLAHQEPVGDRTTLSNPQCLDMIAQILIKS